MARADQPTQDDDARDELQPRFKKVRSMAGDWLRFERLSLGVREHVQDKMTKQTAHDRSSGSRRKLTNQRSSEHVGQWVHARL